MDYELVMQLLSAGVIAALVTGIFSLVIAIKNNKRLLELETVSDCCFFLGGGGIGHILCILVQWRGSKVQCVKCRNGERDLL